MKFFLNNKEIYFSDEKIIKIQPYILVDSSKNNPTDFIISGNIIKSNQFFRLYEPNYLVILDNQTWYPKGDNEKIIPFRWMNQDGQIYIYVKTPGVYRLNFSLLSFLKNRHINIKLNNIILSENKEITQTGDVQNLKLNLLKGKNIITIHPLEKPDKPPLSLDQRKLSVHISDIKFKKDLDESEY
jgi:hypothetical protein